jgi:raffinose/stachyose/melibiose transport system substrate-binding protein
MRCAGWGAEEYLVPVRGGWENDAKERQAMSRRRITQVATATLLATSLVLAGCGGTGDPENSAEDGAEDTAEGTTDEGDPAGDPVAADAEEVTLTVWSWRTEDEAAYKEIFAVYEEQNPNVTIEFVPYVNTDYNNILATGLAGSGGPDVAQLRAYGGLQPLVEAGQLLPLDGEVATLDDFDDEVLDGARGLEDGNVYGVPFGIQALVAFYHQDIFDELGLEEPEDWVGFMEILDALEASEYEPIANGGGDEWMLPIVHEAVGAARYGASDFREDVLAGERDFTDPDYVASIGLVDELVPYMPDQAVGVNYNDSRALFTTGRAATFIGGSFEIGFWRSDAPDAQIGAFRLPADPSWPSDAVTPGWVDGSYGVSAMSEHPEEATALVEWMGSTEFAQLFANEINQLPALPGIEPQDELLGEVAALYEEAPTPYMLLTDFRYGEPSGTDLIGAGIAQMMLGDATPEDVADSVQRGVEQWFEPQGTASS